MNANDLEVLKKHLGTFELNAPTEGGNIQVIRGPSKGFVAIVGDSTALIRLGTAILKYAIQQSNAPEDANPAALVLDNFFAAPSPARDFMIQLEDVPTKNRQPAKPHSAIKNLARSLFGKSNLPS
jgi:hypothetical protein